MQATSPREPAAKTRSATTRLNRMLISRGRRQRRHCCLESAEVLKLTSGQNGSGQRSGVTAGYCIDHFALHCEVVRAANRLADGTNRQLLDAPLGLTKSLPIMWTGRIRRSPDRPTNADRSSRPVLPVPRHGANRALWRALPRSAVGFRGPPAVCALLPAL